MLAELMRLRALGWRDRWLLLQSLMLLPATALALRVVTPLRLQAITQGSPKCGTGANDHGSATRIAHLVAAASEYGPYRASCLPQSLVLQYFLSRAGIASELRFGVNKNDGAVRAHCWIEVAGEPLIDSPAVHRHYAALDVTAPRWPR